MSHPLIRSCDYYVVLEPGKEEKLLTAKETLRWLENWLNQLEEIPNDLKDQSCNAHAAQRLLDTACELEVKTGFCLKWFAVRMDPSDP